MLMIRVGSRNGENLVIDISKHATPITDEDDVYQLVCAGVSTMAIGLCNAIDEMIPESCEIDIVSDKEDPSELNHITIRVVNNSSKLQDILKVGLIQLKTVALSYPDYIDLKITEV